ncbi:HAD family hydrolase [Kitasatospora sp. GAS1066B]|uniref:HAD family hydrolase n=1 Tax=Kitasatospora sp. GAS1066B TaxID=3156271 RepID=UPI0035148752
MTGNDLPKAVLLDIGMTLIHPSGQVMSEELARAGAAGIKPAAAEAALAVAAEAHHLDFPRRLDRSQKVGVTWGPLLGLSPEAGQAAWAGCTARPDLYRDLDPDAVAVLEQVRVLGIRVAAVSNSDGTLREELQSFGLLDLFDVVVDSTLVGVEKPQPEIFAEALRQVGCSPDGALFVGDGLVNDIFGAYRAGITRTVLYDRHRVYRQLPVPVITRLPELLHHLPVGL